MLRFVLDDPKTKKTSKNVVKKLPFVAKYFIKCDKVILENGEASMFVPDCYKYQKMCNKALDNYPHALGFVSDCYKTQKTYN